MTTSSFQTIRQCSTMSKRQSSLKPSAPPKVKNVVSEADHRMVQSYHDNLYKEYALADLSRGPGQIGLRWRTRQEVVDGRGERTCGNKLCTKQQERNNGPLITLEVPFAYQEHGVKKKELVKLRLCPACLPLVKPQKKEMLDSNKRPAVTEQLLKEKVVAPTSDVHSSLSSSSSERGRRQWKERAEERCRRKKRSRAEIDK
ncbi:folate-sensitive fragile site-like protein [Nitzschia inconspicua]|uniref:Folate-sensitive fragile site-like protein n=1 Tax=Nitzschia inconspicua TaxID=303405 RepID=A0A9K3PQB3_9STRA|nr:folate-sensitive fragile site-like protein [Nitzschia inconspicua]